MYRWDNADDTPMPLYLVVDTSNLDEIRHCFAFDNEPEATKAYQRAVDEGRDVGLFKLLRGSWTKVETMRVERREEFTSEDGMGDLNDVRPLISKRKRRKVLK